MLKLTDLDSNGFPLGLVQPEEDWLSVTSLPVRGEPFCMAAECLAQSWLNPGIPSASGNNSL